MSSGVNAINPVFLLVQACFTNSFIYMNAMNIFFDIYTIICGKISSANESFDPYNSSKGELRKNASHNICNF